MIEFMEPSAVVILGLCLSEPKRRAGLEVVQSMVVLLRSEMCLQVQAKAGASTAR